MGASEGSAYAFDIGGAVGGYSGGGAVRIQLTGVAGGGGSYNSGTQSTEDGWC